MEYNSKEHGYLFIDYNEHEDSWIAITAKGDELTEDNFGESELKNITEHIQDMLCDSRMFDCCDFFNYKGVKDGGNL